MNSDTAQTIRSGRGFWEHSGFLILGQPRFEYVEFFFFAMIRPNPERIQREIMPVFGGDMLHK